jgi:hypothetical protein
MVLCYVDDILVISHAPHATTDELKLTFKLKNNKVAHPDMYLGACLERKVMNGSLCWTMTSPGMYWDPALGYRDWTS